MKEVIAELSTKMQKIVDTLAREFATIHTGRANPALLDNIMVEYQGEALPLVQLANIFTPEANLIVIQPWDRFSIKAIERAILKSNVGASPASNGNLIRVAIPPLSEERRAELAKLLAGKVEDHRVMIRNVRRDSIAKLKKMEKDKEISEDELKRATKQVEQFTEAFISKVSQLGEDKDKEIKEI
jgi:ribosome recycling factor